MAAGFDPLKKLFGGGGGGLFGPTGPQAISAASAAGARNDPRYNVTTQSMMSQPYPDKILRMKAKGMELGGQDAWNKAKEMAGEPAEFEYITKELDRDFIQEAMASALGGAPELPGSGPRPPAGSQPQPGDFATLIPSPIPRKKKKGPY